MVGGPSKGLCRAQYQGRRIAPSQPEIRAVGAAVVSPALQRGVSSPTRACRSPVGTALRLRKPPSLRWEKGKNANRERLPEMSNCCCHPGKAGGSPFGNRTPPLPIEYLSEEAPAAPTKEEIRLEAPGIP